MITVNKNTTEVTFGTQTKATIAIIVDGKTMPFACILKDLSASKVPGEPITIGDYNDLPEVILNFTNVVSIDTFIGALETVRKNIEAKQYPDFSICC